MSIQIYNTFTKRKEEFVPIRKGEVSFYLCGPTVYDYFHIGNARAWIVFDVIRRYLEYRGYNVKYVVNQRNPGLNYAMSVMKRRNKNLHVKSVE